ncbi:hypothetical protein EI613_32370 (plasmid) [Azospirillum sp. 412522]|nr:hypothetical protein [Azospirillum sp. 412522]MBY6266544.1 hypothetical protein [Azospirillum sp. 412522]
MAVDQQPATVLTSEAQRGLVVVLTGCAGMSGIRRVFALDDQLWHRAYARRGAASVDGPRELK